MINETQEREGGCKRQDKLRKKEINSQLKNSYDKKVQLSDNDNKKIYIMAISYNDDGYNDNNNKDD